MGSVGNPAYTWSDHYIAEPKPVRVIAIGAGISGIAFVHKVKNLENVDFIVYEKNADVGGTWLEARYPGVSCDVPAHSYTYSWVGNPSWSKVYVGAVEICEFYKRLARSYGVYEKTMFRHQVVGAEWEDKTSQWKVTIKDLNTGKVLIDHAEVLLNLGGILNNWKWPDIQGLHEFKGDMVHSANWNMDLELSGKRVAVIGSGASGIQIVPAIQPVAKKVISFNRSANWIAGEFAATVAWDGRDSVYTEEQKAEFRSDGDGFREYRRKVEHEVNARFPAFYRNSAAQKLVRNLVTESMKRRLNNDPVLTKSLIPDFPVGCRRVTPGSGYLEALLEDNVEVVTDPIDSIKEQGIVTRDKNTNNRTVHEVDVIICATGYDTSFVPRFPIHGLNGFDLRQTWGEKGAASYMSVAVPNCPNYFLTAGPNTPISNGSLIPALELQIDYALAFIKKIQTQNLRYAVVSQAATDEFNEHKDALMEEMTWSANCTSWYKNGKADGKVIGPWPGSVTHFLEALATPRFEDFHYEYKIGNRFQYLGNGQSSADAKGLNLAWYVK
ncbi:uncharacterized protein Z520_12277 [Fonsecaea multimorphosa CBS 102226]|uniref:FAD/NAD(P)-binding domain-containing protein n=1 Tax=Fonsecaea multimorphosa CBS 102226 TaxID=1442371 RepID=A0A0D2I3Y2_9EURO|nr:uncharacterized protein Z520_12277 [Fonsecaea multimorphosa CBS 102226]KIX92006.1 hypothetical protein Z520_12277 [Fonsecaea multimorphosa CBS 102226]OAL17363.1 hypothetical protein AYO22_11730 [Fonsecaea multimorphosa]